MPFPSCHCQRRAPLKQTSHCAEKRQPQTHTCSCSHPAGASMGAEGRAGGWEEWLHPGPGTLSKTVTVGCSSNGGDGSPRPAPPALCEPRGWGSPDESTGFSASQVPGTLGPERLGGVPPPCPPEGLCAAHSDRAPLGRRARSQGTKAPFNGSCEGHLIPNTASQSCPGS